MFIKLIKYVIWKYLPNILISFRRKSTPRTRIWRITVKVKSPDNAATTAVLFSGSLDICRCIPFFNKHYWCLHVIQNITFYWFSKMSYLKKIGFKKWWHENNWTNPRSFRFDAKFHLKKFFLNTTEPKKKDAIYLCQHLYFFFGGGDVVVYLITSKYRKFKIKKLVKSNSKICWILSYQNNILIKH